MSFNFFDFITVDLVKPIWVVDFIMDGYDLGCMGCDIFYGLHNNRGLYIYIYIYIYIYRARFM